MQTHDTAARTASVTPALQALLSEIVDYAGLFPPAGLPLDDAIHHFARYRTGPDAWMLARFVIPVKRLDELAPYADLFATEPPFRFSVLGTGGADALAFLAAFREDLQAIDAFHRRHAGQVRAEVMEVRLPPTLLGTDAEALGHFFAEFARTTTADLDLFFEVPLDAAGLGTLAPLLETLAVYNEKHPHRLGLKMRTGGLEPSAFPPADAIALAITACRDAGVPFKATAGLHHPVRRYFESVRTEMYGFFNVFGGAVLAATHGLNAATLTEILLDENAAHFHVEESHFAWKTLTATADEIRAARAALAISFGSCSFDEPREDLQALGLL